MSLAASTAMTIRSTRSKNKRQPVGEVSDTTKTNNKKKVQRRKSRQIGDDVAIFVSPGTVHTVSTTEYHSGALVQLINSHSNFYIIQIQERKSKSGKLHRAKIHQKTGGITFIPANRKTPIAYDRHRHTLIEKTPDGNNEIEVDDDDDDDEEDKENLESDVEVPTTKKTAAVEISCGAVAKTQRRGAIKTSQSYAESTDPETSDEESDFEEQPVKKSTRATTGTAKNTVNKNTKKTTTKKVEESAAVKKSKKTTRAIITTNNAKKTANKVEEPATDSDDEEVDEPDPRERTAAFSSPIVKSNWEDQPDWRCASGIDY